MKKIWTADCHVLTLAPLFCLCFSMVRVWVGVGSLCLFYYVVFCVWPGMVLNQRQVLLVVSDWESYLGSLFPPVFRGWLFSVFCCVSAPDRTVFSRFSLLFCYFRVHLINMDTYQGAPWSSPSSTDDDQYNKLEPPLMGGMHFEKSADCCIVCMTFIAT